MQLSQQKTGNVLLSQAASRQVSSALRSLTSVFEMGTGVTSLLLSPDSSLTYLKNWIKYFLLTIHRTLNHMTKLSVECLAFAWDILPSYAKAYDNAYDKENLLVKCSTY